jgi:hypothetical protein
MQSMNFRDASSGGRGDEIDNRQFALVAFVGILVQALYFDNYGDAIHAPTSLLAWK